MSNKRFFGFTEFSNWVLGKVTEVLNTVDGLLANTVQKTDNFGPYTVALASDTTTQEVPILVETVDTATAMVHIVRVGEVVTVGINNGEGNFATITEAEMGPEWILIQEAIDARVGDFDQYFALGSTNQEVTAAARTLKALFEALELADKNTQTRITSEVEGLNSTITTGLAGAHSHADSVQTALNNWTQSIQQNLNRIDTFAVETRQMAFDNQQALAEKVGVGSNVDTNVVTVDEAEVALSQVIADIKAEIATKGSASGESLALLEQKVDDFIAAKATGEEAIAGTDNVKYITALALKAVIAELESRAVLDGEHVSTNLVTFDYQDLVLEKQIQNFGTELLTREAGQELWSVVRNAGVDTFSMSADGVTFNPVPPLEAFPEAQRLVYEALFTELGFWVDDEAAVDGTVFYAVTEDRTVMGPVSKVDVLLKDVLSVLETKVAQLFKDVGQNHQDSLAADTQIRDDLGNLQGEVYDLNRGVVETLAGAPEMAVKFDFSTAWTQGALHQIEALEFLGGDDSVIGTVALDQVKLHSGIMGYENGVINLSGLGYLQPRQTVLNIGDIPAGAVKLRVVGTGLENGVGVLEVGSIGAEGVVYGSLDIVENLDVANSLIVPFAVPKLSDINVLKDQAADVAGRVADLETDKLDATAQAVDSAKLEGSTKAQVMEDTKTYMALGTAAKADIFVSTVDPLPGDGKDGDLWIKYTP